MVKTKININAKDSKGSTMLISNFMSKNYRVAKILIELGADTNIKNRQGNPCLVLLFMRSDYVGAKILLDYNITNVNI